MRCAMQMVTSGALERHPDLKVLVSEGGATWVPYIGDRMNEAYRQHGMFVRPKLAENPKEVLFRQVYTTFQHDVTAVDGYRTLCGREAAPQEPLKEKSCVAVPSAATETFASCVPRVSCQATSV